MLSKSSVVAPSLLIMLKGKAPISSLSLPIQPPVLWPAPRPQASSTSPCSVDSLSPHITEHSLVFFLLNT